MPIQPEPFACVCRRCGWRTVVRSPGDAVPPSYRVTHCGRCHSDEIEHRSAGWLEKLISGQAFRESGNDS